MRISLFPRNNVQTMLFGKTAKLLSSEGFDVGLLLPKLGVSSLDKFFPEVEVSNLIEQNEINFSEEFKRVCKEYKNINRLIQSDRELNYFPQYFGDKPVTREFKIKMCVAFFIVFEKYVLDFKPHIVFSEMVLGLMDGVLNEVCKSKGIMFIGVRPSKMGQGIVFCDTPFDTPVNIFESISTMAQSEEEIVRKALKISESSVIKNKLPHYMSRSSRKFNLLSFRAFRAAFRVILSANKLPLHSVYQHRKLNAFREAIFKYINIKSWRFDGLTYANDIYTTGYFVFAAHFEPEASVQVRAFDCADQLGLIKLISRLLPPSSVLLVKEHRGNQGFRKASFYKEISHLYNVRIISPNENLRELCYKSLGVITMTGRIGLECLLDDVPVIAFGKTFWTHLNSVRKPGSISELKTLLNELSSTNNNGSNRNSTYDVLINDIDLAKLILAYDKSIFAGEFIQGSPDFVSDLNAQKYCKALREIARNNLL